MLTLCAQHCGLDGAQDLQLGRYRWNSLTDLQQVGPDPLVGALACQVLRNSRYVRTRIGYGLRRSDQLTFAT